MGQCMHVYYLGVLGQQLEVQRYGMMGVVSKDIGECVTMQCVHYICVVQLVDSFFVGNQCLMCACIGRYKCEVWLGIEVNFYMYEDCRLRARYGFYSHLESIKVWQLGWMGRWAWVLLSNNSRGVVSISLVQLGSARNASSSTDLMYKMPPKLTSCGSWQMHSLARSGLC